jgi:hypothetical protein
MKTLEEVKAAVNKSIEQVEEAYECDCLISIEFTPAPDYSEPITKAVESSGWTMGQFHEALTTDESNWIYRLMF